MHTWIMIATILFTVVVAGRILLERHDFVAGFAVASAVLWVVGSIAVTHAVSANTNAKKTRVSAENVLVAEIASYLKQGEFIGSQQELQTRNPWLEDHGAQVDIQTKDSDLRFRVTIGRSRIDVKVNGAVVLEKKCVQMGSYCPTRASLNETVTSLLIDIRSAEERLRGSSADPEQ